jgi:hypothetical protein
MKKGISYLSDEASVVHLLGTVSMCCKLVLFFIVSVNCYCV